MIFEDIPKVFPIENPALLNEILKLIANRPGMLLEYQSLAASLGMTRQTASKYTSALEDAFIVRILANYRKSARAAARKMKKAYLVAHAYSLPFVDPEEVLACPSWLVENVVACHLDAKFFWRNGGEVDFVVGGVPVEVKYGKKEDLKWVSKFMEKFGAKRGIVVTRDVLERKMVDAGETVTISVNVTNVGGQTGSTTVTLKINGATVGTENVTLDAGDSTTVTFTVSEDESGTYDVSVDGLTREFTVRPAAVPWTWIVVVIVVLVIAICAAVLVLRRPQGIKKGIKKKK